MSKRNTKKKVLAVASGGGHWIQLLRLRPAFSEADVVFVGVSPSYRSQVSRYKFYSVKDATRWEKTALVQTAVQLLWIILRERPDVVVSTGAAPGYLAIRIGKLLRAKTIWLDSIANVDCLSLSGELVGPHTDLWLTQWQNLERPNGPRFRGSVL